MYNATWVSRHETVEQGAYPNCYLSKKNLLWSVGSAKTVVLF
jgi:hypothetical protein